MTVWRLIALIVVLVQLQIENNNTTSEFAAQLLQISGAQQRLESFVVEEPIRIELQPQFRESSELGIREASLTLR